MPLFIDIKLMKSKFIIFVLVLKVMNHVKEYGKMFNTSCGFLWPCIRHADVEACFKRGLRAFDLTYLARCPQQSGLV